MFFRLSLASLAAVLAAPALAETQFGSEVPGLELVALDSLPAAPADQGDRGPCDHLTLASPETAAGKAVAAKDWVVTGELPFGDLTAVSFIGSFIPSTSGSCELLDGNVGLFAGDKIVALLYAAKDAGPLIGSIEAFGEDGVRVFSGDILPSPVADLRSKDADGIIAGTLAAEEPVCGGAASVPNIYGLPIDKARTLLIAAGWEPVPGNSESPGMSQALAAAGVPEVEECSGTGFGFCYYLYAGPAGKLGVATAGEGEEEGDLPAVSAYSANCN
jgi:hypothetical protein